MSCITLHNTYVQIAIRTLWTCPGMLSLTRLNDKIRIVQKAEESREMYDLEQPRVVEGLLVFDCITVDK